VPVFFHADDAAYKARLAEFVKRVGQTSYWTSTVSEYGVGAATGAAPIQLTEAEDPPTRIDDSEIEAWLASKLNANDPAFGTPDENTLYAIFYPPKVTITLGAEASGGLDGGGDEPDGSSPDSGADAGGGGGGLGQVLASCTAFGGYHQDIQLDSAHNSMSVAYAVMPRCDSFGDLAGIDAVTGAASHEFLEAVTDPFPNTNPAYATVDNAHFQWQALLGGGEIGDMCAQNPSSFTTFPGLAYTVQRAWSNKAALDGRDPCVPTVPGHAYFNSIPAPKDMVPITFGGQTVRVKGTHIAAGQSATLELALISDGPTSGAWTVSARDMATMRKQPPNLKFSFDKHTGQNGDKLQMTIKVISPSPRNRETYIIESRLGNDLNFWIGEVGN
jgi:hypothetical protein